MSPRLPVVSGREAVETLGRAGFAEIRPLRSILRQAALSIEEFEALR